MRKGRDGEEKTEKTEKKKIMVKIVATTSLPVDRLTATDCNATARANKPKGYSLLQFSGVFRTIFWNFQVILGSNMYFYLYVC